MTLRTSLLGLPLVAVAAAVATGAALLPSTASAAMPREQRTPAVVYNPDLDHYLALWIEDRGLGTDIISKRLFTNGLPQGGPKRNGTAVISNAYPPNVGRYNPAIAYNRDRQEYFLVWSEFAPGEGQNVMGVRVSTAGFARSAPRTLAGGPGDQTHPAIAYNPVDQSYLLVWEDNTRDIDDIWGLRVRSNGIPFGPTLALVQGHANAQDPTVARRGDGFLLAWVDDRDGKSNIYGRRLGANGLPVGGTQGMEYVMASGRSDVFSPALDPSSGTLVYNVYDPLTGLDILGLTVYGVGTTLGSRAVGIAVPAADQAGPAAANNAARGETLVVYSDNRSGEFDLYAVRVKSGRPAGRDYPVMSDGFAP